MSHKSDGSRHADRDITPPRGFKDVSDLYDGIPTYVHEKLCVLLTVDHPSPRQRQDPGAPRFKLWPANSTAEFVGGASLMETDDYDEVLAYLKTLRPL